MKNSEMFLAGLGIAATGAIIYAITRPAKASALKIPTKSSTPPPASTQSQAEITAAARLNATQAANVALDQTYEAIREAPAIVPTQAITDQLASLKAQIEQYNADAEDIAAAAAVVANQLVNLSLEMETAIGVEYDRLLSIYQSNRAYLLQILQQYEVARASALQVGIMYSKVRAGLV